MPANLPAGVPKITNTGLVFAVNFEYNGKRGVYYIDLTLLAQQSFKGPEAVANFIFAEGRPFFEAAEDS